MKTFSTTHKFFNNISTNGVAVSISMKRRKTEPPSVAVLKNLIETKKVEKLEGLDPGVRVTLGGISRDIATGKEEIIKYASSSFRHDAGEYRYNRKYNNVTNPTFKEIQAERNLLPEKASSQANPDIFVNFQLQHFKKLTDFLLERRFAKLRFNRDIARRRAIDIVARDTTGGKSRKKSVKNVLVFIGSTSTNTAVNGYVRTPKKKLERALHDWAYVRRVWEFRSTANQPTTTRLVNPIHCRGPDDGADDTEIS